MEYRNTKEQVEAAKIKRKYMLDNLMTKGDLVIKLTTIDNLKHKALITFLYLFGCRIEEVVKMKGKVCDHCGNKIKHRYKPKKNEELTYFNYCKTCLKEVPFKWKVIGEPIKKAQIEFHPKSIVAMQIRSLKRGVVIYRNIPVPYSFEEDLIQIIKDYLEHLNPEDYLFNMTRQNAHSIIKKYGLWCHYLRHLKSTRLSAVYGLDASGIKDHHGWASSRTADHYVHLNWQDLENKMLR